MDRFLNKSFSNKDPARVCGADPEQSSDRRFERVSPLLPLTRTCVLNMSWGSGEQPAPTGGEPRDAGAPSSVEWVVVGGGAEDCGPEAVWVLAAGFQEVAGLPVSGGVGSGGVGDGSGAGCWLGCGLRWRRVGSVLPAAGGGSGVAACAGDDVGTYGVVASCCRGLVAAARLADRHSEVAYLAGRWIPIWLPPWRGGAVAG